MRFHIFRLHRDRAALPASAERNRSKLAHRKEKFGAYGKRGAAIRHAGAKKVKTDTRGGENSQPNEVTGVSPKHSDEHLNGNRGGSASSSTPDEPIPNFLQSKHERKAASRIDWQKWAEWLSDHYGEGLGKSHFRIMTWLETIQKELDLGHDAACIMLDRFLKIMRNSGHGGPTFQLLLEREKSQ